MAPLRLVATLVAALGASICLFCSAQPQPLLRFSSEGKLTISMLTDLHLGEQKSTDTSTFLVGAAAATAATAARHPLGEPSPHPLIHIIMPIIAAGNTNRAGC
jgi:hypothetical protein